MAPPTLSSLQDRLNRPKPGFNKFHGPSSHSAPNQYRRSGRGKYLGQHPDYSRPRGFSASQQPLFGPGSKKANLSDPTSHSQGAGELMSKSSYRIRKDAAQRSSLLDKQFHRDDHRTEESAREPLDSVNERPVVDDSSDDDDSEAIANALLGRTPNSALLFGRSQPVRKPLRGHKEDGEVSEEDPARVPLQSSAGRRSGESFDISTRRTSLLARMGHDYSPHASSGPHPIPKTNGGLPCQGFYLLDISWVPNIIDILSFRRTIFSACLFTRTTTTPYRSTCSSPPEY